MAQQPYDFGFGDTTNVIGRMPLEARQALPQMTPGAGMQPPLATTGQQLPVMTPGAGMDANQPSQTVIEQLLARIKGDENPVTTGSANLGTILGGLGDTEAANRATKGAFTQSFDQNMLNAQAGRDTSERDALKKLAITNYLKSGGFQAGPAQIQLEGMKTLPSFGSQPRPASASQMSAAGTLEDMLKQRLASGGSYLPQPLEGYAEPGKLEKLAGYGGAAASGLGAINDIMGGEQSNVYKSLGQGVKKLGGGIIGGLKKIF